MGAVDIAPCAAVIVVLRRCTLRVCESGGTATTATGSEPNIIDGVAKPRPCDEQWHRSIASRNSCYTDTVLAACQHCVA